MDFLGCTAQLHATSASLSTAMAATSSPTTRAKKFSSSPEGHIMLWRRAKTYQTSPVRTGLRDELNRTQTKIAGFDLMPCRPRASSSSAPAASAHPSPLRSSERASATSPLSTTTLWNSQPYPPMVGRDDIGRYKAHCLARNLANDGHLSRRRLLRTPFASRNSREGLRLLGCNNTLMRRR